MMNMCGSKNNLEMFTVNHKAAENRSDCEKCTDVTLLLGCRIKISIPI